MHLRTLDGVPNLPLLRVRQHDVQSSQILLQILDLSGAWDRDDILPLGQQPSERQLGGGAALLLGQPGEDSDELQVLREVLGREAGGQEAEVARLEVGARLVLAGDEAAAQRRVGDDGDAELAACAEEADLWVFDVHAEGRVFDLHGGDGVHGVCAAEGGG